MSDQYDFIKDDQGRDVAVPKKDSSVWRAHLWDQKMERMGRSAKLRPRDDLDHYQKKIIGLLESEESNAILYGRAGSGKTTVALHGLRALHMVGHSVAAWRFAQFKTKMEPRWCDQHRTTPEEVLEEHAAPKYLLLDDLGYGGTQAMASPHEQRVFFDLVNARDSSDRLTWIVTNSSRDGLYQLYGDAAISRLEATGRSVVGDFTKRKNYRFE